MLTETQKLAKMLGKIAILQAIGAMDERLGESITIDINNQVEEIRCGKDITQWFNEHDTLLDRRLSVSIPTFGGGPIGTLMKSLIDPEKSMKEAVSDCVTKFTPADMEKILKAVPINIIEDFRVNPDQNTTIN